MKVSQLMSTPWMIHKGLLLNFVCLLIDNIAFIRKHRSNVVFFLLSTNEENFILSLNRCKLIWKDVRISNSDLDCALGIKLMNKERFLFFIVIMQSWFNTSKNIIWLEADYIMQEPSKFVYFAFDLNNWSGIFLDEVNVLTNFRFKFGVFRLEFLNKVLLLKDFEILLALIVILQF